MATTRRKRLGARFDGLAQDNNGQLEYLAMETSRTFDGETSSKWLCDTRKVAKSLHGMLYRLQGHVKQDGVILREMHMAGLVSAGNGSISFMSLPDRYNTGLHCQVLRMTYAKGHVCILSRDQLLHVPTTMEPRRLCPLLLSIWRMKVASHTFSRFRLQCLIIARLDDCPEVQGLRRETWAGNQAFGLAVTPEPPEPSQLIDLMSHYSSLL